MDNIYIKLNPMKREQQRITQLGSNLLNPKSPEGKKWENRCKDRRYLV
ncbi:MAG: hypothetical protein CM15mV69_640 [Caudoviricetes sp.]|nr:MAG: hypothetical protein CM15mV69_640 [Caudoviricetes sp.]